MRATAHAPRTEPIDEVALRRSLRADLTRIISTGQHAGVFRDGDPQALATLIIAGLDARLSAERDAGEPHGRGAANPA